MDPLSVRSGKSPSRATGKPDREPVGNPFEPLSFRVLPFGDRRIARDGPEGLFVTYRTGEVGEARRVEVERLVGLGLVEILPADLARAEGA